MFFPPKVGCTKKKNLEIFKNVTVQVQFTFEIPIYERCGAKVQCGFFLPISPVSGQKRDLICVCPGGRLPIIYRNLNKTLSAVLSTSNPTIHSLHPVILIPKEMKKKVQRYINRFSHFKDIPVETDPDKVLPNSEAAISFPGTMSLQLYLWKVPTLIFGTIDFLTFFMAKKILNVHQVSLPNLLSQKSIFPELLTHRWNPTPQSKIDEAFKNLFETPIDWQSAKEKIGPPNGVEKAVNTCLNLLNEQNIE